MKKRLLTVLLAVCLVVALGTVTAMAADTLPAPTDGVITLEEDVTMQASAIQSALETLYTDTDAIVIDLAQHTLTITQPDDTAGTGIRITQGNSLTIRNGSIVANEQDDGSHSVLIPLSDTSLIMENVNMTTNGTALYPAGDASNVEVRDCNITAGVYVVGTNAKVADGELIYSCNVNISLVDSKLSAVGYENNDGQTCTVMINVPGTLNIDNCTIRGGTQAVLIRGGDATITDSNISIDNTYTGTDYNQYKGQNWGSGNSVPIGAIIVGNRGNTGSAYHYPASCDISGTTVSASDSETSLYVYQMDNTDDNREVTLKIDSGNFGKVEITDANDEKVASIGITGGTYDSDVSAYFPDGAALTQDSSGKVVEDNTNPIVARVDGIGYTNLQDAINAASESATVTLEANITNTNVNSGSSQVNDDGEATLLIVRKDITIVGNGHTIALTVPSDSATCQAISVGDEISTPENADEVTLTLSGVDMTIHGNGSVSGGDGFDVWRNATLNIIDGSDVNFYEVRSAFTVQGGSRAEINVENSTVMGNNVNGNFSNGGNWNLDDASVYINSADSYGLSVDNLVTTGDTNIGISNTGYGAIYAVNTIDLGSGTDVNISDCGTKLPYNTSNYGHCYAPIQIRCEHKTVAIPNGAGIVVREGATVTVTDTPNDVSDIYVPFGTDFTNGGTVNATVKMEDEEGQNTVTLISNGNVIYAGYVADNGSFKLPVPDSRNGYTFGGWRDNSGELHKAGETVTVNGDMTFTAVWSAINIPDTYDIEIADTANGEVDTSLSNASAGSTITITATPDSGYSVASVTVTGPDGRVDVVRVNATTYTFKMPAGDVTVRVTFTDSDALPFTDVRAGQWFYDAVAYVYTNGMMEGDSATTFNPDGTMTRAMFWAVLGRIDGATITGTNWADQARDWAMAEGVSDGTDPNGLVTREQMVTMLWRYAGEPESSASLSAYTDADSVSDWAETAMRWAIDEGIITGMTDTTLVPQGAATRAQCAAIFMRFDQM